MGNYYDRAGNPITVEEWAKAFENAGNVLLKTDVDEATVSTVWLGVDHSFGSGPPLLFETMIFDGPYDHDQWRYPTEAEALAHHDQLVAALRQGDAEPPEPKQAPAKGKGLNDG